MLDDRYGYKGPKYDAMGRLLPEREEPTWEEEKVYHSDLLNQDFINPLVMGDAERKERMRRNGPSKEELELEAMPREEWEPKLRALARQEYAAETAPARVEIGDTFVLAHPEFRDSTANANKLWKALSERMDPLNATINDYERAYQTLVSRGEIALNQAVLNKQNRQRLMAAAQRHLEETTFDVEEAEKMSLEELARRSGGRGR